MPFLAKIDTANKYPINSFNKNPTGQSIYNTVTIFYDPQSLFLINQRNQFIKTLTQIWPNKKLSYKPGFLKEFKIFLKYFLN